MTSTLCFIERTKRWLIVAVLAFLPLASWAQMTAPATASNPAAEVEVLRRRLPAEAKYRGRLGSSGHIFVLPNFTYDEAVQQLQAKGIQFAPRPYVLVEFPKKEKLKEGEEYRRLAGTAPEGWRVTLESLQFEREEQNWKEVPTVIFTRQAPSAAGRAKPAPEPSPQAAQQPPVNARELTPIPKPSPEQKGEKKQKEKKGKTETREKTGKKPEKTGQKK